MMNIFEQLRSGADVDMTTPEYVEAIKHMTDCANICFKINTTAPQPEQIRILEIYASEDAYQHHLKTDHFLKYKQGTLHMVKDLKLPTMRPLDPKTMDMIFKKLKYNK
ncbi:MAG: antibiotic biosynthesis monooxygenase [Bacteroidaceae bacterium]|nr:antibiotic biosynthesis monooxygenase [Bacteroidaceae bacterium]